MSKVKYHNIPFTDAIYSTYEYMTKLDPFNKLKLRAYYDNHIISSHDLIPVDQIMTIDVSNDAKLKQLYMFLDITANITTFPHKNKTPS